VFTIHRVAKMPGEDKDLLYEIAMDMEPEDGRLFILDVDDDTSTVALTQFGIKSLQELLADRRR
jgi:hypothetical protein